MKKGMPIDMIVQYAHLFNKKYPIYDLGIGTGRNAYFLAEKGHRIIGIDNDPEILSSVSHLDIYKICTDINGFLSENIKFANILATFSLRFTGENFLQNVQKLQENTIQGGIHILVDFIDDGGEFVDRGKNKDFYWLQQGELQELYKNKKWEIIDYYEENTRTKVQGKDGKNLYCLAGYLVARKK